MTTEYAITLGLDVGKTAHHGCALTPEEQRVYDHELPQDETALGRSSPTCNSTGRSKTDARDAFIVVDQPDNATHTTSRGP